MNDNHVDTGGLEALSPAGGIPPPRRSDAAFARSVKDGVHQRRTRWLLVLPALVGATAAIFVVVGQRGDAVHGERDAGPTLAVVSEPSPSPSYSLDEIGIGADFAIPSLDGSSDEELARLDAALDAALAKRGIRG